MLLCEVALGNVKEVGRSRDQDNEDEDEQEEEEDDDDDVSKPLDLERFQSRKGTGRQIPDPKHTITQNYGLSFKRNDFL
jgi:hypothetical protein